MKGTSKNTVTTAIRTLVEATTVKRLSSSSNRGVFVSLSTPLKMEQPVPLAKLQPSNNEQETEPEPSEKSKKVKKSKKSKKNQ